MNSGLQHWDPGIHGMEILLREGPEAKEADRGFAYYPKSGLNIVAYGPPGVGKTILALQMATAAFRSGKSVIYLSKDTSGRVLADRIRHVFGYFSNPGSNPIPFIHFIPPPEDGTPTLEDGSVWLEKRRLMKKDSGSEDSRQDEDFLERPFFAFTDFSEVGAAQAWADRYQRTASVFLALSHLQPRLRPLFEKIESLPGEKRVSLPELVVVCDSLRPEAIEEHLRFQTFFEQKANGSGLPKGVFIFVMESNEIPDAISVAFPPDVQIRLGFREEAHGIRTRTIQLIKTRFQKSLDEETPFVILGSKDISTSKGHPYQLVASHQRISISEQDVSVVQVDPSEHFLPRQPGMTVMPPLSHEVLAAPASPCELRAGTLQTNNDQDSVQFKIQGLDQFTREGSLAGGGCTLLVTQNRCGSTALSLHYLLGEIGASCSSRKTDQEAEDLVLRTPRSVLCVLFSADITGILHTIWRHPCLRRAILPSGAKVGSVWNEIGANRVDMQNVALSGRDRLYEIALHHRDEVRKRLGKERPCPDGGPHLLVYVPDFTWRTAEEALDRIMHILDGRAATSPGSVCPHSHCRQVDRVVIDRVSRLPARWPLVSNHEVFLSGIASLCGCRGIELMLIDDTVEANEPAGSFRSRWVSIAQNIIRLRRIAFHGAETQAVELVRAAGRIIAVKRPRELIFNHGADDFSDELLAVDSFRGYTGLFAGEPSRCTLKLDLSYDEMRTPLHREVLATKRSLEASMDAIEVQLLGPGEWSGINSAFNSLSSATRNACHIVAIDGIWLPSLLSEGAEEGQHNRETNVLHELSKEEVLTILPDGVARDMKNEPLATFFDKLKTYYVTQSLTTSARWTAKTDNSSAKRLNLAIPMRHNWGVFAVSRLSAQHMRYIFSRILGIDRRNEKNTQTNEHVVDLDILRSPEPPEIMARIGNVHLAPLVFKVLIKDVLTSEESHDGIAAMWKAIWSEDEAPPLHLGFTWEQMARFRVDHWHKFWSGAWVETRLGQLVSQAGASHDPWITLFPRIDLFGLATTTQESIVSFLLELLLAEAPFGEVFEEVDNDSVLLKLNTRKRGKSDLWMARVMLLFYSLLSPTQRRHLAIGTGHGHRDIGVIRPERMIGASDPDKSIFADWPPQITLFSREWLTTVQDLLPRYDVRHSIRLFPLPKGEHGDFWTRIDRKTREYGPCVGGAWYLGILRGGNADLGAEIMKEILSEDHEMSRLITRCSGPVSKRLYEQFKTQRSEKSRVPGSTASPIPYADVIADSYCVEGQTDNLVFPFDRNQIQHYLKISPVLYGMVRRVMDLPIPNESSLAGELDATNPNKKRLGNDADPPHFRQIRAIVTDTYGLLRDIAAREKTRDSSAAEQRKQPS